jgi:hypothetical protein
MKRVIGRAIECCTGHHMQGVKRKLIGVLHEISEIEDKKVRRRSVDDIYKQWTAEKSSSVAKMSEVQAKNALGEIENMINTEHRKIGGGGER